MSNEIKELTPEQEAHLATFVDKYTEKMTSQDLDKGRFESALSHMYQLVGYDVPKIIYCDSPRAISKRVVHIQSINILSKKELDTVEQQISTSLGISMEEAETVGQRYLDSLLTTDPPSTSDTTVIELLFEKALEDKQDKVKALAKEVHNNYFYTYWLQGSLAFAEAAQYLGVKIDQDAIKTLEDFGQIVGYLIIYGNACFVSLNPVSMSWQDDVLHNESGPAVEYKDGYKVWCLEGMLVDEQLVMHPETQALEQINSEENMELKRIRISRYGWTRYLAESNAEVLDTRIITLPSGSTWMESLMKLDDMVVLTTYDPSTGRPYALEVSENDCVTCEDAQRYLLAPEQALEGCSFRPESVLPVLRT